MQNIQNADIQRVMNLVDLYRTKVGKESEAAKAATREYNDWEEFGIDESQAKDESQWEWLKVFNVNDQLLGHFYEEVAGKNAEEDILQQLLPKEFDSSIYSQEEECFLIEHFKEMVNYIIHTPDTIYQNSYGSYNSDRKAAWLIPEEVLTIIKKRVCIPQNAIVYNPYPGLGQLSRLFNSSLVLYRNDDYLYNYYISVSNRLGEPLLPCIKRLAWMKYWTWARISMYANHQNVQFIEEREGVDYDVLISDVRHCHLHKIEPFKNEELIIKIHDAYNHLRDQGIMVLLCQKELLFRAESESTESIANKFRNQLVTDGSLVEVIQLPSNIMAGDGDNCIVIAQKGQKQCYTTLIDAKKMFKEKTSPSEPEIECRIYHSLDLSAWDTLLQNKGVDNETGLRKMVQISCDKLNPEMLLPQFYVLERPTEIEHPVTLSSICNLVTEKVGKLTINLPLDTPWVKGDDITLVYQGGVDVSVLEKANCPNNPPHTKDFAFRKDGTFIGFYDVVFGRGQKTEIGRRVVDYRHSYFIDGSKDVVLQKGMSIAVIRATGKPIAISGDINVFVPNETMDALSLAALLQMPVVNRQIEEYQKISPGLGLSKYMDDILVPIDKRIICDETQRLLREEKVYKELTEKLLAKKTEYINEVRMRKHDMGQYVFELMNIEDLMRYYLDNRETETDYCQKIAELLDNFRSSIGELSTLLDNLSKEEQFGEPERLSIDKFLSQLKSRHKAEGFKIEYEPDESYRNEIDNRLTIEMDLIIAKDMELQASLDDLIIEKERENSSSLTSNKNMVTSIHRTKPVIEIPSVYVSQNDLQRAVNNILDNARKHGFTDVNRKDYEIRVSLAIDVEKNMFQIDFRNNGNPLPEGMNKMRYGIKGEKAGKTAGTGLGGNYVKSFVEHYGGDYDIFMEDGWTVVRIFLPIK